MAEREREGTLPPSRRAASALDGRSRQRTAPRPVRPGASNQQTARLYTRREEPVRRTGGAIASALVQRTPSPPGPATTSGPADPPERRPPIAPPHLPDWAPTTSGPKPDESLDAAEAWSAAREAKRQAALESNEQKLVQVRAVLGGMGGDGAAALSLVDSRVVSVADPEVVEAFFPDPASRQLALRAIEGAPTRGAWFVPEISHIFVRESGPDAMATALLAAVADSERAAAEDVDAAALQLNSAILTRIRMHLEVVASEFVPARRAIKAIDDGAVTVADRYIIDARFPDPTKRWIAQEARREFFATASSDGMVHEALGGHILLRERDTRDMAASLVHELVHVTDNELVHGSATDEPPVEGLIDEDPLVWRWVKGLVAAIARLFGAEDDRGKGMNAMVEEIVAEYAVSLYGAKHRAREIADAMARSEAGEITRDELADILAHGAGPASHAPTKLVPRFSPRVLLTIAESYRHQFGDMADEVTNNPPNYRRELQKIIDTWLKELDEVPATAPGR